MPPGALRLPGFPACLGNRPDKSLQMKPRRSRTQRAVLKPRSTAPSSVHFTPDRLRSASISETPAQCERQPRQMMVDQPPQQGDSGRWVAVPDDCFVTRHQMLYGLMVKKISFNEVKKQEARSRMAAIRRARRSPQAAAEQQRRASLVGNGAKWRITNFKQVAQAIAKWR
jgi:hypothetical protein